MEVRDDIFGRGLNANPNNLVERLELLILETKAGHDGLYDEMLDIYLSNYYLWILLIKTN